MTATAHALIGTVIAAKLQNPLFAFPIAFASHFLLDVLPHWDTGFEWRKKTSKKFFFESVFDVILGFILSYGIILLLFPTTNIFYAFAVIIVAQLPDWLMAPYLFLKIKVPIFYYFYKLQHALNNRLDKPWGIINQIAVILVVILAGILL